ncbi:hypothetical protein EDD86DRAFT_201288 [Gorgonomyces haynaldii]|nr:hypothetical protein EDD86DRAFT_201288 [Gorgonomyces haynaldii]
MHFVLYSVIAAQLLPNGLPEIFGSIKPVTVTPPPVTDATATASAPAEQTAATSAAPEQTGAAPTAGQPGPESTGVQTEGAPVPSEPLPTSQEGAPPPSQTGEVPSQTQSSAGVPSNTQPTQPEPTTSTQPQPTTGQQGSQQPAPQQPPAAPGTIPTNKKFKCKLIKVKPIIPIEQLPFCDTLPASQPAITEIPTLPNFAPVGNGQPAVAASPIPSAV